MFNFLKNNKSNKTHTNTGKQPENGWYLIDETDHRAYKLPKEPVFIGRDKGCQVQMTDQFCSRRHARIDPGENHCVITDLNTINGLEVDGEFVGNGEQTLLEDNSGFKVANTQFYITHTVPGPDMTLTILSDFYAAHREDTPYYNPDYDPEQAKKLQRARSETKDRTIILSGKFGFEDTMYFENMYPDKEKEKK